MGCSRAFSKNHQLGGVRKVVYRVCVGIKSAEMNVSDLQLFKKSKIIEIGSVKKSYGFAKLEIFENFRDFRDFRTWISAYSLDSVSKK